MPSTRYGPSGKFSSRVATSVRVAKTELLGNMRRKLIVLILGWMAGGQAYGESRPGLEDQARDVTRQFTARLLPTLQGALANGGPVEGIKVCANRAPEIAAELSESTGWSVRRVSLKVRNAGQAVPDAWEREILEQFEEEQRQGMTADALNEVAIVDGEFRYMQAQLTMPLCLNCHGSNLSAEVSDALQQHYPADLATGYKAGEVRGAISLRYLLD